MSVLIITLGMSLKTLSWFTKFLWSFDVDTSTSKNRYIRCVAPIQNTIPADLPTFGILECWDNLAVCHTYGPNYFSLPFLGHLVTQIVNCSPLKHRKYFLLVLISWKLLELRYKKIYILTVTKKYVLRMTLNCPHLVILSTVSGR